jgi:Uma2 family endonuclease
MTQFPAGPLIMATVTDETSAPHTALPGDEHVLLRDISWATYEALLQEIEGNRRLYLTYDRGNLEIMSPSHKHEYSKRFIGRMIEAYTETWHSDEERGFDDV